jgi:hypothetical protein
VIRCHYCGAVIDAGETFRQAVWGWEKRVTARASGAQGGSDIEHRQKFDRFSHVVCIDRERAGVNARQQALV